ncbi:DUF4352 domain-containing protein [Nocardia blacklockiae]|uniref:DUF4352 domain-containing protein n=1 Tax=Nocardia blacklockiae TaxID=480036 RepID=UPI001894CEEF|nr:DUF4352 domain-containing protein [Nocardia blacklockiae]MBF6171802.1 DUF4352 domain-containing protein [Nocardia blacklockiae]
MLGALVALVVLMFGGCAVLFTSATHEVAEQGAARTSVRPAGSEVRDGKFGFAVTRVDPPVTTVGDNEYLRRNAQGEYVLVHVDVTNIGDKPQTYFGENQKLVDNQGNLYTNDTMAEMNVNKDLVTEINPGNKISVVLAFDVPVGTAPAAVEFHDSAWSGGVRVAVG